MTLSLAGAGESGRRLTVLGNGVPLDIRHWDGTQAIVGIPQTANGPLTIEVEYEGRILPAVTVETYGFARRSTYPVRFGWFVREYPVDYGVSVVAPYSIPYSVAGKYDAGSFSWIHLSTGVHREFSVQHRPGDICHGVGILTNPPAVVTCPAYDSTHVWRIETVRLADHGPGILPGAYRWFGQVSSDYWIEIWPHGGHMRRISDGYAHPHEDFHGQFTVEDSYGVEILESAGLATIESYSYNAPVINTRTGEVEYKLGPETTEPPIYGVLGAAADEGRRRFYVAAGGLIASIEAASGRVINHREMGSFFNPFPLEHAPGSDVLLVLNPATRELLILDPETLQDLGRVDLDAVLPGCWYSAKVLADPHTNMVYLVFSAACSPDGEWIIETPVIEVRLPPPGVIPRASTTSSPAGTPLGRARSDSIAFPASGSYPRVDPVRPLHPASESKRPGIH